MSRGLQLAFVVVMMGILQVGRGQCFLSSSGATCCPEVFPCSSTRCIIDLGCDRGAATCTSNVCRRPGSEQPTPLQPVPASTAPPAPIPSPAPATAPPPGPSEEVGNNRQDNNQRNENEQTSPQPTVYHDLLRCGAPRTRREIRDMSDSDWDRFANAVNELKRRPSLFNPNVNQYEDLARIHTQFVVEAHGGSYFLPWHRMFLLLFENLLRQIDADVSVPYWNWAADAADPAMSFIWNRVGGSTQGRNGQPTCISDGPFENMQTVHTTEHCVRRGFVSYQSGSITPFDNMMTIQALINRDISFARFSAALEATHGSPHVGVGGDMAVLGTAPNDPIFFMHHAYVDYIYYQWQNNGNGIPGRFGGRNPGVSGRVRRDDILQAFQRTVRHAQRLNCVNYQEFSGSFGLSSESFDINVKKLPEDFVTKNHLNQTRIDEGQETLQESLILALTTNSTSF